MAYKARSIRIFLLDGEPDGIRTAQIAMSTIKAIAFKSDQLGFGVKKEYGEDIKKTGVYFLIGTDPANADNKMAYIGESEEVVRRLNDHKKSIKSNADGEVIGPGFWEDTVVFVSKDDTLTKSHVRYVEAQLIKDARKNKAWSFFNGQNPPQTGKLPKEDELAMDEFVNQVKTLAGALGFDLFRLATGKLASAPEGAAAAITTDSPEFHYGGKDFAASAIVSGANGEWVVKAGSTARLLEAGTIPKGAHKRRDELIASEVLKAAGAKLRFATDYAFASSSMAAAVVSGQSVAGPAVWKRNGKTYSEWEAGLSGVIVEPETDPDLLTQINDGENMVAACA